MPEKITYEEILIENLTKAVKDVVEQINENDLWSGLGAKIHVPKTPHTSPMHDTKDDGDIQKVTRPKAEKVAEKNPVGGELKKAPPIRNPRRERHKTTQPNDDLTMEEYEKLFREKVDPIIESEEAKNETFAHIDPKDLKMNPNRALEVARELYKNLEYNIIFLHGNPKGGIELLFDLRL